MDVESAVSSGSPGSDQWETTFRCHSRGARSAVFSHFIRIARALSSRQLLLTLCHSPLCAFSLCVFTLYPYCTCAFLHSASPDSVPQSAVRIFTLRTCSFNDRDQDATSSPLPQTTQGALLCICVRIFFKKYLFLVALGLRFE